MVACTTESRRVRALSSPRARTVPEASRSSNIGSKPAPPRRTASTTARTFVPARTGTAKTSSSSPLTLPSTVHPSWIAWALAVSAFGSASATTGKGPTWNTSGPESPRSVRTRIAWGPRGASAAMVRRARTRPLSSVRTSEALMPERSNTRFSAPLSALPARKSSTLVPRCAPRGAMRSRVTTCAWAAPASSEASASCRSALGRRSAPREAGLVVTRGSPR